LADHGSKRTVIIPVVIPISALLAIGSAHFIGGRRGAYRLSPINVLLADFASIISAVNSEVRVRGVTLTSVESPLFA